MQGAICHHAETSAIWLPDELSAIISNPQKHDKYALITNSPKINQTQEHLRGVTCSNCGQKMEQLKISLLSFGLSQQQISKEKASLRYSILRQSQKQGQLHSILGEQSFLNHKRSSILTQKLAVCSQKDLGERFINSRKLYSTSSSQVEEQIQVERDMSSSIVFSIHKQDQMEKYTIYVTKMQKTSLQKSNSSFFHEFAWSQAEIEFIMSRIAREYGEIHSFLPRRRYLVFTFMKHAHNYLFLNKYERIERELVWKQNSKLQGCALDYYILSKSQLLQSEMQTSRLFLLPNNQKITDLAIAQQWIIVAAQTYVLFIHSYRSMQLFHHEQISNPTKIAHHHISSKVLFIADLKGILYCFHLQHQRPILMAKYNVCFVRPHCISHLDSGMAIAGIDHDGSASKRRSIYLIRLQGLKQQKKNKPIPIEMRLQVVVLSDARGPPINNIAPTKIIQIVGCNCGPNFYLVSIKGFKLIEVKLASSINQIIEVPFLFNELNFIVMLQTGEVIRVGMESYGQRLGTEINQVSSASSKDCITFQSPSSRFQLLVCNDGSIDKLSYLNSTRTTLLKQKVGTVVKLAWKNEGMAYLLDLEHSIELKYLEI